MIGNWVQGQGLPAHLSRSHVHAARFESSGSRVPGHQVVIGLKRVLNERKENLLEPVYSLERSAQVLKMRPFKVVVKAC